MKTEYVFPDGSVREMELEIGQYANNDNLYMGIRSLDGTERYPLTVNIEKLGYPYATLDVNNMTHGVAAYVEAHDIARFTGQTIPSGFCQYPVFAFNTDVLKEIDPKVFAEYRQTHGYMSDQEIEEVRRLSTRPGREDGRTEADYKEGLYVLGTHGATTYVASVCRLEDCSPGFMGVNIYEMGDASRERRCFVGVMKDYATIKECVEGIAKDHTPLKPGEIEPRFIAEHRDSHLFDDPCKEAIHDALDRTAKERDLSELAKDAKTRSEQKNSNHDKSTGKRKDPEIGL